MGGGGDFQSLCGQIEEKFGLPNGVNFGSNCFQMLSDFMYKAFAELK